MFGRNEDFFDDDVKLFMCIMQSKSINKLINDRVNYFHTDFYFKQSVQYVRTVIFTY